MRGCFVSLGIATLVALVPMRSHGDAITEATISVDASGESGIALRHELVVKIEGSESRSAFDLFLHRDVQLTRVSSSGKPVSFTSADVEGTGLRKWSLDVDVTAGQERRWVVEATVGATNHLGIHVGADGGYLLPGSGWFPSTALESEERAIHTTSVVAPRGSIAIAAGTEAGSWKTAIPARPFAVWGEYVVEDISAPGGDGAGRALRLVRKAGRQGEPPGIATLTALLDALTIGMGEPCGEGPWTLVDIRGGVTRGGLRTLFWDEQQFAAGEVGGANLIQRRDLAGALAASFWTECVTFRGDLAAWISHGTQIYLGDATTIALDPSDDWTETEAVVIGSRRAALIQDVSRNGALTGLVPVSDDADRLLATRGALVAHLAAEAVPSRSKWVEFLALTRKRSGSEALSWLDLRKAANRTFPRQHAFLEPWLNGDGLAAFRITDHEIVASHGSDRYRVEVRNEGNIEGRPRSPATPSTVTSSCDRGFGFPTPIPARFCSPTWTASGGSWSSLAA